jgi:serine protease AprX
MHHKILFVGGLIAMLLTSCASPTATTTKAPSTVSPTSTHIVLPTNTSDIASTQSAATQIAQVIEPYQFNRSNDLRPLQRTLGEEVIQTLWFNQTAEWWSAENKETAKIILKLGMNPGLGVRDLHDQGITGKGVTVAIIDQPMRLDHPEFEDKVVKYHVIGTDTTWSMHGPAVTSLLVGENIGTAPDASVYFVGVPSWLDDAQYYADALDWIIAENKKLPEGNKIRVVSVSTMPSGLWALLHKNQDAWDAAYKRATDAGLLVLDCTYEQGITVPCTYDLYDPDNVSKCIPNWSGPINPPHPRINIPTRRTTAVQNELDPVFSYQYTGIGGLSWTVPYLSGVLAMGWQINPQLTSDQLLDMIFASAYETNGPADIINPVAFIELVRQTINE